MSLFDRRHGKHAHARTPVPATAPQAPETGQDPAPDDTMYFPVVEEDVTPAVRPLPVPEFNVPAEFPLALPQRAPHLPAVPRWTAPLPAGTLGTVAGKLRTLPDSPRQDEAPAPAAGPALPGAYLFWVTRDGKPNPHEALTGDPEFFGLRRLADGTLIAGFFLADADETGRFGLDALDRTYLVRLRDQIEDALWAMEQAGRQAAEGSAA